MIALLFVIFHGASYNLFLFQKPFTHEVLEQVLEQRKQSKNISLLAEVDGSNNKNSSRTEKIIPSGGSRENGKACNDGEEIYGDIDSSLNNNNDINDDYDDDNHKHNENQCAICMEEYEVGTDISIGTKCIHMYHTRCILKWMIAQHDFCPFCREYLFDITEFKNAVQCHFSQERFEELVHADNEELVALYMGYNSIDDEGIIINPTDDPIERVEDSTIEDGDAVINSHLNQHI